MYPKAYGTITRRRGGIVDVQLEDGTSTTLGVMQRLGGDTPTGALQPGVRVKLFQRPGDRSQHFRRVGR